jgi:hypothetical protein
METMVMAWPTNFIWLLLWFSVYDTLEYEFDIISFEQGHLSCFRQDYI